MKILRPLLLLSLLSLGTASVRSQDHNEFRWQGRIGAGKTVEIKGVNGVIRAEGSSHDDIEIVAVKRSTWTRGDADKVQIKLVEQADGITVCALYPRRDGSYDICKPGRGGLSNYKNNASVEFKVRIPNDVHFIGRAVNSDVVARGLSGNVEASTVNGGINVATTGYASASTVNGSITAVCESADWDETLHFSTVNGSIELTLPANAQTELNASLVNGSITTDLPLLIKGSVDKRHLVGTLGSGEDGGRKLRMHTVNGSITVKSGRGAS
jgi:hypothetical protein